MNLFKLYQNLLVQDIGIVRVDFVRLNIVVNCVDINGGVIMNFVIVMDCFVFMVLRQL